MKNKRTLIKDYMEYEFGNGTDERINQIMDLVDEYEIIDTISVDLDNQVCKDEDLMVFVQWRRLGVPYENVMNMDFDTDLLVEKGIVSVKKDKK